MEINRVYFSTCYKQQKVPSNKRDFEVIYFFFWISCKLKKLQEDLKTIPYRNQKL